MPATSLVNASVIVTGGSSGFGTGIAQALVQHHAKVWITGRNREALEREAAAIGATALVADVTSPADWDRCMATVKAATGRLDVLVNNAGAGVAIKPAVEASDADLEQAVAVNLTGAMYGCSRAARLMVAQKSGIIINISSVCDRHAWPGWGAYSAAKAGLLQYSRCLYTELRPHGVRVTCLSPSWGSTAFLANAKLPGFTPDVERKCIAPSEIGEVVAQLCEMPAHLAVDEMVLRPMVQEIIPL